MNSDKVCPISVGALEDFLSDVFRQQAAGKKPVLDFLEAYNRAGGGFKLHELALMAGNVCPETGRGHGLPSLTRGGIRPAGYVSPYERLTTIVVETTGWQPGGRQKDDDRPLEMA